jgi:hypothetical protein
MLVGKIKEVKFLPDLIGKKLPNKDFGRAGRAFEDMLEKDYGITVNRGKGPDNRMFGIDYKTRDLDSVSPQTVASMSVDDIIKTPYRDSDVFKKFQQQIRIKTKNNVIVEADLYDFRSSHIQEKIEAAYEYAREQLTKDKTIRATISGPDGTGYWGYFENSNNRENSRSFRINPNGMNDYETMAKSTFASIFDYGV